MYNVQVVGDSLSPHNHRLITAEVTFPRIILAEFNTHCMLARNSSSSRAIPFPKMLQSVMHNPFVPLRWMKDHSGMQGTEYFADDETFIFNDIVSYMLNRFKYKDEQSFPHDIAQVLLNIMHKFGNERHTLTEWWLIIRDRVVECAALLFCFNVSKQVVNRLLEPFMWHTVIVSATEWDNFFSLRAHPAAEMHMAHIADMMLEAFNDHKPKVLKENEWHIPYESKIEELYGITQYNTGLLIPDIVKVSSIMCARVSYTVVGVDGVEWNLGKYLNKYIELSTATPIHASPFEHLGLAMEEAHYRGSTRTEWISMVGARTSHGWSAKFKGFHQLRKLIPFENVEYEHRLNHPIYSQLNAPL